jgi:hypothetical protein
MLLYSIPLYTCQHGIRGNITNAIFSNTRKVGLDWSWETTFANYIWILLQNASTMCKGFQGKKYFYIMNITLAHQICKLELKFKLYEATP